MTTASFLAYTVEWTWSMLSRETCDFDSVRACFRAYSLCARVDYSHLPIGHIQPDLSDGHGLSYE